MRNERDIRWIVGESRRKAVDYLLETSEKQSKEVSGQLSAAALHLLNKNIVKSSITVAKDIIKRKKLSK